MNEDLPRGVVRPAPDEPDGPSLGMSSVYRLFEAFIALREKNAREHKMFEQTVTRARDALQDSFNTFASQTQKAYQQLRQEIQGEKKVSLSLLNDLLDLALDLDRIVFAGPSCRTGRQLRSSRSAAGSRRWKCKTAKSRKFWAVTVSIPTTPSSVWPIIQLCMSASAAGAWKGWMLCGLPSSCNMAMPASSRSLCCGGRKWWLPIEVSKTILIRLSVRNLIVVRQRMAIRQRILPAWQGLCNDQTPLH